MDDGIYIGIVLDNQFQKLCKSVGCTIANKTRYINTVNFESKTYQDKLFYIITLEIIQIPRLASAYNSHLMYSPCSNLVEEYMKSINWTKL